MLSVLKKRMMGRAEVVEASGDPAGSGVDGSLAVEALETVAAFLRAFGRDAFETDSVSAGDTRAKCEAWATRVLAGPSRAEATGTTERVDWLALRRYIGNHRRHEADFVARSMTDLKQAMTALVGCLESAVQDDRRGDSEITEVIERFGETLGTNDTRAMRRASAHLIRDVQNTLERRRERHRERVTRLANNLRAVQSELAQSRRESTTDPLTKLQSRDAFEAEVARAADMALLLGPRPSLFVIRIDQHEVIRGQHGAGVADEVLKRVSDSVQRAFPRRDDLVARSGDAEIGVIICDCPPHVAQAMGERARSAVAETSFEGLKLSSEVTISMGIARLGDEESALRWMRRAQRALADAMQRGSRVVSSEGVSTEAGNGEPALTRTFTASRGVVRQPPAPFAPREGKAS
jgi:diguanylate cyclase (GGDEF)-like protein